MNHWLSQGLLLVVALVPCLRVSAQTEPVSDYIPASTFLAIHALPKAALADPSMELIPRELIRVFGEKELGVDLLELETAMLLVATPEDPEMAEPPGVGMAVRFSTPQQPGGNLLSRVQPNTFEGRKGLDLEGELQFVQLDPRTWIVGTPAFARSMLAAKGTEGTVARRVRALDDNAELAAFVDVAAIRPLIVSNLPPRDQVPPPFQRLLELPELLEFIEYRSSIDDLSERLLVDAVDADAAGECLKIIEQGIETAKSLALNAIAAESGISDPDYQQAIMDYAQRIAEWVQVAMRPEVDGATLVFEGQRDGGPMAGLAVTGTLIGMLLPAVQQVREAARRTDSANRLRQFAIAILNYESVYQRFPPQYTVDDQGTPLLSWRVHILPYIEEQALYEQFHLDEPWDSPHNIQLLDQMPEIYGNPNLGEMDGRTVFLGIAGPQSVFSGADRLGFAQVVDGTSNTVMLVEADAEAAVPWTKPADWEFDANDPFRNLGGLRPAGFNVAFVDGSVRLISVGTDPNVWKALCTRNGNEVVRPQDLD